MVEGGRSDGTTHWISFHPSNSGLASVPKTRRGVRAVLAGGGSGQFDVGQRTRRGWPGNVTLLRQVLVFDLRRDNMNLFHPFFEFTVARTTDVQCFGLVVGLVTYNLQHKGFVVDVGVGALSVGGKEQSALFFFARCITVREVRGMKLKISFLPIAPRFAGTFLQVALA